MWTNKNVSRVEIATLYELKCDEFRIKQYDACLYIFILFFFILKKINYENKNTKIYIYEDVKSTIKFTFPNEAKFIANFV